MEAVDEWKSAWEVCGGQCVMMAGTAMMLLQCVDNWDTMILVLSVTMLYVCFKTAM